MSNPNQETHDDSKERLRRNRHTGAGFDLFFHPAYPKPAKPIGPPIVRSRHRIISFEPCNVLPAPMVEIER